MANSKVKKTRTILLLGEAGAGKSTLINSFANYSTYQTFKEALEGKEMCLIPRKFLSYDENVKATEVNAGIQEDENEDMNPGQSGTLSCKSYVFDLSTEFSVRFIDTSGFADTKGPEHDIVNLEDILDYAVQFKKIHVFAIVMQANQTNESKQMKNFFHQIFIRFGKDALQNVIFIFTHGKRPQNSLHITRSVFDKLSQLFSLSTNLNFDKSNMFCFENEPFSELLEIKKGFKKANNREMEKYEIDWAHSTNEFARLLKTVFEKIPYTVSIPLRGQNAIEYIRSVCVITGILLSNIDRNLNGKISAITNIEITSQENAISMCLSHKKCTYTNKQTKEEFYVFGRNVCCDGCHLNFGRRSCKQINFITAKCKKCNCNLKKHVFFFYNVKTTNICGEDASKHLNNLREEKASIINGLKKLIDSIEISDKRENYSCEASDADTPYGYAKHLYWLSWKGNPSDQILKIKEKLENLPVYGETIAKACETNSKNNKKSKQNRDKKVELVNNVFKIKFLK